MIRKRYGLILVLLLSVILTSCGQKEIKNAKNWPLQDFTYTDQDGKTFGLSDLKGKVWVSDFIFTTCVDVCMPMTANMAKLQTKLKDEGIKNVELVSFSVDPAVDNPEQLKMFSKNFNADLKNWHFLTGYKQEEIEQFALKNYKTIVKKPVNEDQVIHGTDFYLIDKNGTIVKYYNGLEEIPFKEIINDIKTLQ
ncbi:SCO family protein [Bacillus sp. 1NLA3E]|uniref:SCO family protein n=1 Tax=Bacillus sp. 1NLA3E TaxID=666686 RepID=UPI000247F296|nr:SCO family protein [Bacillus sp. 1NLA3E]AGK54572.1 electron transport protein SCO1/SenC [Bacillus sp. 1NLA3E]